MKSKLALNSSKDLTPLSKGLTLSEVLITLVVLAILVAILIVIINPLEYLHRTQDSNAENVAIEYINACTRYYANHGEMAWKSSPPSSLAFDKEPVLGYTQMLISEGELKPEFNGALDKNNRQIYLTAKTNPPEVIVCFDPGSKSLSVDEETRYGFDGSLKEGCPDPGEECYWCLRQE